MKHFFILDITGLTEKSIKHIKGSSASPGFNTVPHSVQIQRLILVYIINLF